MGGFGSGGRRVGAGRKSKGARVLDLHGGRDRKPKPLVVDVPVEPVDPPKGLTKAQLAAWRALAPHALAARTLTPATVGSFVDLCQAIVLRDSLLATIEEQGWTFRKAILSDEGEELSVEIKKHPLVSDQRGWEQRVEAGRARFKLAPIGKEIAAPAKPADPFAEFDEASGR